MTEHLKKTDKSEGRTFARRLKTIGELLMCEEQVEKEKKIKEKRKKRKRKRGERK